MDPAAFIPHIENPNPTALEALITKPAVERALLTRLGKKASIYGPEIELPDANEGAGDDDDNHSTKWKIDVESVRELYESWIIPLTKEVEVSRRLAFRFNFAFSAICICVVSDFAENKGRVSPSSSRWPLKRRNRRSAEPDPAEIILSCMRMNREISMSMFVALLQWQALSRFTCG